MIISAVLVGDIVGAVELHGAVGPGSVVGDLVVSSIGVVISGNGSGVVVSNNDSGDGSH